MLILLNLRNFHSKPACAHSCVYEASALVALWSKLASWRKRNLLTFAVVFTDVYTQPFKLALEIVLECNRDLTGLQVYLKDCYN